MSNNNNNGSSSSSSSSKKNPTNDELFQRESHFNWADEMENDDEWLAAAESPFGQASASVDPVSVPVPWSGSVTKTPTSASPSRSTQRPRSNSRGAQRQSQQPPPQVKPHQQQQQQQPQQQQQQQPQQGLTAEGARRLLRGALTGIARGPPQTPSATATATATATTSSPSSTSKSTGAPRANRSRSRSASKRRSNESAQHGLRSRKTSTSSVGSEDVSPKVGALTATPQETNRRPTTNSTVPMVPSQKKSIFDRLSYPTETVAIASPAPETSRRHSERPEVPTEEVPAQDSLQENSDRLIHCVVHLQSGTLKEAEVALDKVHSDLGVVPAMAVHWYRKVEGISQPVSRKPILFVCYRDRTVAEQVRLKADWFDSKGIELGPTERQIRTCTEISPFGRQVFRNERALDDLLEREGFPGLVQLWRFILDFSVSKLERGLDYYFRQWLETDPSRKARNHPFLHVSSISNSTESKKDFALLNESDFSVQKPAPASDTTEKTWLNLMENKRQELKRIVTLRSANERFLRKGLEMILPGGVKIAEELWQKNRYESTAVRISYWKPGLSAGPAVVLIKFTTVEHAALARKQLQGRSLSGVIVGPSNMEASVEALSSHPEWLLLNGE